MVASTTAGGVRSTVVRREVLLYAAAAAIYVALGLRFTTIVLNWIVGPLFPFLVVWLVPRVLHRDRDSEP